MLLCRALRAACLWDIATRIDRHLESGVVVLRPEDRLDIIGCLDLEEALEDLLSSGRSRIVLDLSLVSFVNSTCLAVMERYAREAEDAGGRLVVAAANAAFRRASAAALTDPAPLPCCGSVDEALGLLSGGAAEGCLASNH